MRGLAILDSDGRERPDVDEGGLRITYWRRYEIENYFITPELLRDYALGHYPSDDLLSQETTSAIDSVLQETLLEFVFDRDSSVFSVWNDAPKDAARLIWQERTSRRKLSDIAEIFFRRLAAELGGQMLLRKGELHRLIELTPVETIPAEVSENLDLVLKTIGPAHAVRELSMG